jgi:hypothetical protein
MAPPRPPSERAKLLQLVQPRHKDSKLAQAAGALRFSTEMAAMEKHIDQVGMVVARLTGCAMPAVTRRSWITPIS